MQKVLTYNSYNWFLDLISKRYFVIKLNEQDTVVKSKTVEESRLPTQEEEERKKENFQDELSWTHR